VQHDLEGIVAKQKYAPYIPISGSLHGHHGFSDAIQTSKRKAAR
jgi:hypothetical protein